jgi:hypothetical protein
LPTLVDLSLDLRQHLSGVLKILLRPDRRAYGGKLGAQRQQRKIRWVNQIVKDQLQR